MTVNSLLQLCALMGFLVIGCSCDHNFLTSYLPATMQALAYYIDNFQYEPLSMTTVEPPFSASDEELDINFNYTTTTTTPLPITTTRTTSVTTRKPTTTTTTTQRPSHVITTPTPTTTKQPNANRPTPPHRPGIFAPTASKSSYKNNKKKQQHQKGVAEGYELFNEIDDDVAKIFDMLSLSLIRDITNEKDHDGFGNDVEALDNFLRLYDDNYGRPIFVNNDNDNLGSTNDWSSTSTTGKKRVPPTKPYVEFLLLYDLLKRDAKAANLNKYEGYSDELLYELYELSNLSSQRQLFTLFKRMLERGDVQRSDVVSRLQGLLKEVGNPNSITVKALQYIPALKFLP